MALRKEIIAGVAVAGLLVWFVMTPASSASKRKQEQVSRSLEGASPFHRAQPSPAPALGDTLASIGNEVGRYTDHVAAQLSSFTESNPPTSASQWEAFKSGLAEDGKKSREEVKRLAGLLVPASLK